MSETPPRIGAGIVVGVDGSPHSVRALRWAAGLAPVLGPLRPVRTWQTPWWAYGAASPGVVVAPPDLELQQRAERDLDQALRGIDPSLIGERLVGEGHAGPTLVQIATGAELLVVGTRGRGAVTDRLLGSVSSHCAAHATVPVAVVPSGDWLDPGGRIEVVIGVDGSENSEAALRWVLDHLPSARLTAVGTWGLQPYAGFEFPAIPVDELHQGVSDAVAKSVQVATAHDPAGRDRIGVEIHQGDARQVLRERAEGADLLVVGARGHRGLAHVLLGSVATSLVHQPVVPTIVVPHSGAD
jgi:nucleotide-binding universal stress UspA family protein